MRSLQRLLATIPEGALTETAWLLREALARAELPWELPTGARDFLEGGDSSKLWFLYVVSVRTDDTTIDLLREFFETKRVEPELETQFRQCVETNEGLGQGRESLNNAYLLYVNGEIPGDGSGQGLDTTEGSAGLLFSPNGIGDGFFSAYGDTEGSGFGDGAVIGQTSTGDGCGDGLGDGPYPEWTPELDP